MLWDLWKAKLIWTRPSSSWHLSIKLIENNSSRTFWKSVHTLTKLWLPYVQTNQTIKLSSLSFCRQHVLVAPRVSWPNKGLVRLIRVSVVCTLPVSKLPLCLFVCALWLCLNYPSVPVSLAVSELPQCPCLCQCSCKSVCVLCVCLQHHCIRVWVCLQYGSILVWLSL